MQFCGHNCASSIGVANVFTVEMKNTPNSIPVLGAVGNKDQGKRSNDAAPVVRVQILASARALASAPAAITSFAI